MLLQGYHGLSKDEDRLWAMEVERGGEAGRALISHPAHPALAWPALSTDLPPPGALPLPPHHALHSPQVPNTENLFEVTYDLLASPQTLWPVTQTGARPRETTGLQPLLAHPPQRQPAARLGCRQWMVRCR